MLDKIREGSQGPAAKIILGAVILSFALAGISGYLGQTTEQPVAEVNGVQISQTKFSRAYNNERARMEQQFGEYFAQIASDPTYMAQMRQGIIDRLVQEELQNQLAKELGLRVSDEQLKKTIFEMPYFQVGGVFNNDRYLQAIRQLNFQPDAFREYLREEMTRSQLVSAVAGTDFLLSNEAQSALSLEQQTRSIDYLVMSTESVKSDVVVSEDEILSFYQLNQSQFQSPEQVVVEYIELQADALTLEEPITDESVEAYFNESKSQYTEEERRRVAHILIEFGEDKAAAQSEVNAILGELNNGADFATLAEEKSQDFVSAELGGDLDWIERDVMEPAFEDAAFALTNVGDISEVVESEFGFHIIKLTDLVAEQSKSFDEVKDELRAELELNAKVDLFYQKQAEVAEVAFEVSDSLEDAALTAGVEVKKTQLVTRQSLPAPLNSPAISNVIFSPELIEDSVNSEVLDVAPEHFVVARIAEHKPSATKPLEEVSADITARLTNDKASELIREKAEILFAELEAGKLLSEVAASEGLEIRSETELTRRSYAVAPAIVSEAFKLPKPKDNATESALVELNNGDSALIALKAVVAPEQVQELEAQQKQSFEATQINKNFLALLSALEAKSEVVRPVLTLPEEE